LTLVRVPQADGEFVEAVQLQIICQNLWRDLPSHSREITMEDLRAADIDSMVLKFYENALSEAAGNDSAQKARLQHWIERQLITPAGTRGMAFRGKSTTAGLRNETVDVLVSWAWCAARSVGPCCKSGS
jgi:hypothetical protein